MRLLINTGARVVNAAATSGGQRRRSGEQRVCERAEDGGGVRMLGVDRPAPEDEARVVAAADERALCIVRGGAELHGVDGRHVPVSRQRRHARPGVHAPHADHLHFTIRRD